MIKRTSTTYAWWLTTGVVGLFLIYGIFQAHDILRGVPLRVVGIESGREYIESVLPISGNALRATKIAINGRDIYIDKKGNFKESLLLPAGYSIVTIETKDKFGKSAVDTYQVYRKGSEQLAQETLHTDQTF